MANEGRGAGGYPRQTLNNPWCFKAVGSQSIAVHRLQLARRKHIVGLHTDTQQRESFDKKLAVCKKSALEWRYIFQFWVLNHSDWNVRHAQILTQVRLSKQSLFWGLSTAFAAGCKIFVFLMTESGKVHELICSVHSLKLYNSPQLTCSHSCSIKLLSYYFLWIHWKTH